jgi:hypothetical protein
MGLFQDLIGLFSGNQAANDLYHGYMNAEQGILGATGDAQKGISNAVNGAFGYLPAAQQSSVGGFNDATKTANDRLASIFGQESNNLSPYMAVGQQGAANLASYANSPDSKFQFKVDDYFNSPAYQFQLGEGKNAIQNTLSASGMANSGAAAKKLEDYGQGLASTYYNQAFQQAQGTFQTNQNATLANNSALMNAGQVANSQFNSAAQNYGNTASQNDVNAGLFAANSNLDVAKYLSQLGFQGAVDSGMMGMQGANSAGNFGIGAASALSGKALNTGNAVSQGVGDLATLLMMFMA